MGGTLSPIFIFFFAFIASGAAGVAAYLRSGKIITKLALVTAGLNSGLLGLAICLLYYNKFKEAVHFLLGICVLSGLTGAAGLDFILTSIQSGGIQIKFNDKKDKDGNDVMGFGITKPEETKKDEPKKDN